jgi:gliding motility-associated-like protein
LNTAPNPSVAPQQSTTYFVFVTTGKCAVEMDSIVVTLNPLPVISVIDDQSIGAGASVILFASGAEKYLWTPEVFLNDNTIQAPVAIPQVTTLYTVEGTDQNGCRNIAEVEIIVQNQLFIPNLFTPNGDGNNDIFKIYGSGVEQISFSIYDQLGNRLYHTNNVDDAFQTGWDGTFRGKVLKNDLYFWTIDGKYFNGETIRFAEKTTGIIKLMR